MSRKKNLSPTRSLASCLNFAVRVLSSTATVQEICTKPVLAPMVVEAHRFGQQVTKHLESCASTDIRTLLKVLQGDQNNKLSRESPLAGLDFADLAWVFEGTVTDTLEMELQELESRAAMNATDTCVVFSTTSRTLSGGQAVIWFPRNRNGDLRDADDRKKRQILIYVCPGRVKVVKSVDDLIKKMYDELPTLRESGATYNVWEVVMGTKSHNQQEEQSNAVQLEPVSLQDNEKDTETLGESQREIIAGDDAVQSDVDNGMHDDVHGIVHDGGDKEEEHGSNEVVRSYEVQTPQRESGDQSPFQTLATVEKPVDDNPGLSSRMFTFGSEPIGIHAEDDTPISPQNPATTVSSSPEIPTEKPSTPHEYPEGDNHKDAVSGSLEIKVSDSDKQGGSMSESLEINDKKENSAVCVAKVDSSEHFESPVQNEKIPSVQKPNSAAAVNYRDKLGARVWWELAYTARRLEREEILERQQQARQQPSDIQGRRPNAHLSRRMEPTRLSKNNQPVQEIHETKNVLVECSMPAISPAASMSTLIKSQEGASNKSLERRQFSRASLAKPATHESVKSSFVRLRDSIDPISTETSNQEEDEDEAVAQMMWGSTHTTYELDRNTNSNTTEDELQSTEATAAVAFNIRGRVPMRSRHSSGKVGMPALGESSSPEHILPTGDSDRCTTAEQSHLRLSRYEASTLIESKAVVPTPAPVATFIALSEENTAATSAESRQERLNELRQKKLQKLQQARDMSLQQQQEKQRQSHRPLSFANSIYSKKASNRQLIQNALEFTLLAGGSMEKERTLALQALAESTCDNFIVLLKSAKELKFRALYENHVDRDCATRIYSVLPGNSARAPLKLSSNEMISQFFKYSSAKKQFLPVPTRSFTVKTDACALVDQLVFKGKSKNNTTSLARLL